MPRSAPTRCLRSALAGALGAAFCTASLSAQFARPYTAGAGSHADRQFSPQVRQSPAPIERRPPPQQDGQATARHSPEFRGPRGEHLAQWFNQHSNLTPDQQQHALEQEPGFRQLPLQTQQRMRNRLAQLDAMPPQQRMRIIENTEVIEHLSMDQRAEVRGAMQQLGSLPLDQRRAVARSFRELRNLPPDQRSAAANSPRYGWMNESQRSTLNHLLHVEPLLPPPDH